jgi:2'-5' RNA ligase
MAESEEGKIPLNIVLLPDTAVKNWAITHSYRVTRHFPGEFNLDGDLHKAHLSLVHGEYPQSAIGTLATLLEGIAMDTAPFQIDVDKFAVSPNDFLHWKATKSQELMTLQRRVSKAASSVGTVISKGEYDPHITLTKLKRPDTIKPVLSSLGAGDQKSFMAESMSIMDLGAFGAVSTLRADIPFLL